MASTSRDIGSYAGAVTRGFYLSLPADAAHPRCVDGAALGRYNARVKIVLNGEVREVAPAITISALLEELGLESSRVAVEQNREIVPRRDHARTAVAEGDQIEVVHFVGGG
jgi:sulfur carrier protein